MTDETMTTADWEMLAADLFFLAQHQAWSVRYIEEYAARNPSPSNEATLLEARDMADRLTRDYRIARRELDRRGVPQPPEPATLTLAAADIDITATETAAP